MPSKSKKQQKFMGMVRAVQKGELSPGKVGSKVREAAKDMSYTSVKHFAETKHKGLPETKTAAFVEEFKKFAEMNDMINQVIYNKTTASSSPGLEKLMSVLRKIEVHKPLHPGKNPETKIRDLL